MIDTDRTVLDVISSEFSMDMHADKALEWSGSGRAPSSWRRFLHQGRCGTRIAALTWNWCCALVVATSVQQ